MPLYLFECNACGGFAEVLQSFADRWPSCTKCKKQMNKKPSLTSFSLKGNGWARDNYGLKEKNETK
jgi:putative FmdB family regulatory protein